MALIGAVALIVIGPEKLPKVARMAGTLYGRAQRYLNEVKSEVSREIEMEELRNLQKDVQNAAQSIKQDVENSIAENLADVQHACDVFSGVWERTGGVDGRVSLEVDPRLAHDTEGTAAQASELFKAVDRTNLLVKIPATEEGLTAITRATAPVSTLAMSPRSTARSRRHRATATR